MLKVVVCSAALIGALKLIATALNGVFDNYGQAAGLAACAISLAGTLFLGWLWDRNEARRSQAEQPPEPPYSRTIDL